tara:strand:+ start:276 stop:1673 length:1398 start_codon:yes stop_codon:yes gene_type:complete
VVTPEQNMTRVSPLDGSIVTTVNLTSASEIPEIVERARKAFSSWSKTTIESRGRILRNATAIIEARSEELAAVVRKETGKPLSASLGEVGGAVEMGYLMASHGRHEIGTLLPSAVLGKQVRVQRIPRGVAALIVTYNAPLPNYAWKCFPALMAGNTAILKPSLATPLSAEMFVSIMHEAGVPQDVLQLVHGGAEAAGALVESGVELVSFTGSYPTGRKVVAASAKTLAKTIIELGGSNPLIVCADANLDKAADAVLDSAFSNAGQRCSSASRVVIEHSVYEEFRKILTKKASAVTFGVEPDVDVSTLVDDASAEAFENFLKQAIAHGGKVERVGKASGSVEGVAALVQPAIIEGLDLATDVASSEIFGPATRLFSFSTDDEAIEIANSSEFGLTAAVWSSDIARAERIVAALQSGVININGPTHGAEVNMPFGGLKNSGNGSRDAGIHAIDQYADVQVVSTFFGA